MRRALLALALGAFALAPGAGHATSCASPSIDAMPHERRAGRLLLVTGDGWVEGCAEPETCPGCGKCDRGGTSEAHENVSLFLRRAGSTAEIALGAIEVEGGFSFAEEVRLPRDLEPGRYRVVARVTDGAHAWSPVTIVD